MPDENGEEMLDDSDKEPPNQYEAKDIATYAMDITKDVIEVTKDVNCGKVIAMCCIIGFGVVIVAINRCIYTCL